MAIRKQALECEAFVRLKQAYDDRKAVLMRYFYGMPHRDIARRLGIKEAAARKKIERALKKLGAGKED